MVTLSDVTTSDIPTITKSDQLRAIAKECKSKSVRDGLKRFARTWDDERWFAVQGEFEGIAFRWMNTTGEIAATWQAAYATMYPRYAEDEDSSAPPVMPGKQ